MKICGFQKTTLLDFPEHVAATVFAGGCNFRCPFCHNAGLVLSPEEQESITEEEVLAHLRKRRGLLTGVCITGGEPTLQPELKEFVRKLKELGYAVKLDTNGYRPQLLRELLTERLLDYVAMDVKASLPNYAAATGCAAVEVSRIEESIALLKGAEIPCEFRTTVVEGIHTPEEFESIGKLLEGSRAYFLQGFEESENMMQEGFRAFSLEKMREIADIVRKYVDKVQLRGVG